MRILFILFAWALLCFPAKAQSPLSFTLCYAYGVSPTITCAQPYVQMYIKNDYTVSPVSYTWTNGQAVYTGSLVNLAAGGNYTITAAAQPSLTLVYTWLSIAVNTLAPSSAVTPASQLISCNAPNATVNAATSATHATHQFMSPAGGMFIANSSNALYTPGIPGTYTHVVTDNKNGCSTQDTFTITATPGFPAFSLSSAENFSMGCLSKSLAAVDITQAVSASGGSLSYTLTQSASYATGPATSYSFYPAIAGDYTVVVKDNMTSCEAKLPLSIYNNTFVPPPPIIDHSDNMINCYKPKIFWKLNQAVPGNYSFGWCVPAGAWPVVLNHPYDTLTVFPDPIVGSSGFSAPWAIIINSENSCWRGMSRSIDQDLLPPSVLLKATPPTGISCKNLKVTLSCNVKSNSPSWNPGPVVPYFWEGPVPQVSSTLSSGYVAQTPGVYTVHVRDIGSGCTNTTSLVVYENRVYPNVTAPPATELCSESVTLAPVLASAVPLSFSWLTVPGSTVSASSNPRFSAGSTGIYTVQVTNPANGCEVSVQLTVTACTTVGIEERKLTNLFSAYPNPVKDLLFVETAEAGSLHITDALSRPVATFRVNTGKCSVELSGFPAGVYLITYSEDRGRVTTLRLIKEN